MHLLNPQPINPYKLTPTQIRALNSNKSDIVVVENDYVWWLGFCPYIKNIRWASRVAGTNPHYISSVDYVGDGLISKSNKEGFSFIDLAISKSISVVFQAPFAGYTFINNQEDFSNIKSLVWQ